MTVASSRTSPYLILFLLVELMLMILGSVLAVYLRLGDTSEIFSSKYAWYRILAAPVILQITFFYFDLYNFRVLRPFIWTITRVIQAMTVGTMGVAVVYYLTPSLFLGRGVTLLGFTIITSLMIIWRAGYGWALKRRIFATRVLMLCSGSLADAILEELSSRADNVYNLVCILDLQKNGRRAEDKKSQVPNLLGFWARLFRADYRREADELLGLVRYYQADIVVVALSEKRGAMPLKDMLRTRMAGVPVITGEDFFEDIAGRILSEHVKPSWMVFSASGFNFGNPRRFVKRTFDLLLSSLGLILSSPLALLTAVAVRLDSKGPVVYRQERVGQHGRIFTMFKFRSMVDSAEDATGPIWAQEEDARVTRVGKIIRKLRLDEIPQMVNVLKGEMSFVGPRPERPHFVESLNQRLPFYAERHNVKPGITGWAQICYPYGSSEAAALEKLNYDLYYIKHSSLGMDLTILVQTVKILVFGGGGR